MIFGKYINRYYLKHAPVLLLGLAALLTVDYIQLLIPAALPAGHQRGEPWPGGGER